MSVEKQPPTIPPEGKSKVLRIKWYTHIDDAQLAERTMDLSKALGVSPTDLCRKFIAFGLIAAKLEDDPGKSLVEHDLITGRDTIVRLKDQESLEMKKTFTQSLRALITKYTLRFRVIAPLSIENEFTDLAKRYQITEEEVTKKMTILGIKFAESSLLPNRAYYLVDTEAGTRQRLTIL